MYGRRLSEKQFKKYLDYICGNTVKCKCGHTMFFTEDKTLCTWCGHWIYKTPEIEFKEKLKSTIKRLK